MNALPFSAFLALADCAARAFAQHRTAKHPGADAAATRSFLRHEAVTALRFLWRSSAPSERTTLACRVAVWMDRPVEDIYSRVSARESKRGGPQ